MTLSEVISQIDSLPAEDRWRLAEHLAETLAPDSQDEQAFDAELARRAEEIRSGRAIGIPADEAIAELRRALA